ncbi:unnamed protein product [Amoebophrya sp. A120]|nr:unnamed protein product [Amoebophrya sp. A120]|eukprot:GSA120T00001186001.1
MVRLLKSRAARCTMRRSCSRFLPICLALFAALFAPDHFCIIAVKMRTISGTKTEDTAQNAMPRTEMAEKLNLFEQQTKRIGQAITQMQSRVSTLQHSADQTISNIRSIETDIQKRNATALAVATILQNSTTKNFTLSKLLLQQKTNVTAVSETREQNIQPISVKKTQFQDFQLQVGDAQASVDRIRPVMEKTRKMVSDLEFATRNWTQLVLQSVHRNLDAHLMDESDIHRRNLKTSTGIHVFGRAGSEGSAGSGGGSGSTR